MLFSAEGAPFVGFHPVLSLVLLLPLPLGHLQVPPSLAAFRCSLCLYVPEVAQGHPGHLWVGRSSRPAARQIASPLPCAHSQAAVLVSEGRSLASWCSCPCRKGGLWSLIGGDCGDLSPRGPAAVSGTWGAGRASATAAAPLSQPSLHADSRRAGVWAPKEPPERRAGGGGGGFTCRRCFSHGSGPGREDPAAAGWCPEAPLSASSRVLAWPLLCAQGCLAPPSCDHISSSSKDTGPTG